MNTGLALELSIPAASLSYFVDVDGSLRRACCARNLRTIRDCDVFHLDTRRGTSIVVVYFPLKPRTNRTILFSHGNAVDLGGMMPFYRHAASEPGIGFPISV
jgi:hypothetical protein